jgi:tyrosyl-tRNA synthetase
VYTELSIEEQVVCIRRGTAEIISEADLARKLEIAREQGRPLRVKLGLDPTAPDIHLGFAVVLRKLRQFQDLGHEVIVIIGDFTAMIGDPSERSKTRPQLSEEEVKLNAKTYEEQYCKILDPAKTRTVFNSQWLSKMSFTDVIKLGAKTTVARVLARDDFANRLQEGIPISMHEILYPICQGYDSVVLEADVEMGGTDQKFNILMGRDLQRAHDQDPQVALLMPLLVGLDGHAKMSKSLGNYVGIYEPSNEMYAKLMSIPDEVIFTYFELATDVPLDEIRKLEAGLADGSLHPKAIKQRLAREVVTIYHDQDAAKAAEVEFDRVHRDGQLPEDLPEVVISASALSGGKIWIARLITQAGFAKSSSEARRLVQQGGVRLEGERITDPTLEIALRSGSVLQVGKRRFAKLVI